MNVRITTSFPQFTIMRGLPRMLIMFAPMIFRAASKYYKKWQATRQQEEYAQDAYNQAEEKLNPDKTTYKNEDMV
jgi:hypothetical protein